MWQNSRSDGEIFKPLFLAHPLSLSLSVTHTHTYLHTHTHTTLAIWLTLLSIRVERWQLSSHTHPLSLSLSVTKWLSYSHTRSLSLSITQPTLTLTHSLSAASAKGIKCFRAGAFSRFSTNQTPAASDVDDFHSGGKIYRRRARAVGEKCEQRGKKNDWHCCCCCCYIVFWFFWQKDPHLWLRVRRDKFCANFFIFLSLSRRTATTRLRLKF